VISLNKKLIILGAVLVLALFVINACQYKKPVGAPIGNNEETDVDPVSACKQGCWWMYRRCTDRCSNQACRNMCIDDLYYCADRCNNERWTDKLEVPNIENLD